MPTLLAFLFITLCLLGSGYAFPRFLPTLSGKRFGRGLFFIGLLFAVLAYLSIPQLNPPLKGLVGIGGLFMIIGMFSILSANLSQFSPRIQLRIMVGGVVYLILFVIIRQLYPGEASFSDVGLFSLNPQPIIQCFVIGLLSFFFMPTLFTLGHEIKGHISATTFRLAILLIHNAFLVLFITSATVTYLFGIWTLMLGVFLLLLTSLRLFKGEASHHH